MFLIYFIVCVIANSFVYSFITRKARVFCDNVYLSVQLAPRRRPACIGYKYHIVHDSICIKPHTAVKRCKQTLQNCIASLIKYYFEVLPEYLVYDMLITTTY